MNDVDLRCTQWTDAHFCSLPSQTNVYGLTKLTGTGDVNRILVSSIEGKVLSVEYQRTQNRLIPVTREINFTYIPADAEIVSIDAYFNKGVVIGITFLKVQNNENKQEVSFLNIYYSDQIGEETNLDVIAHACQYVTLNFTPYQLTHSEVFRDKKRQNNAFLLSGSDCKIHMYQYDNKECNFLERNIRELFPELDDLPSCVTKIDIAYLEESAKRLTTLGHQNGLVKVSLVDVETLQILSSWSVELESTVTCIRVIPSVNPVTCPAFLDAFQEDSVPPSKEEKKVDIVYSLLVAAALGVAVVYRDVLHSGLSDTLVLPDSDKMDCILSACVMDIDFDGCNEILIGTYGQQLLAYKYISFRGSSLDFKDKKLVINADSLSRINVKAAKFPAARVLDFDKHRHRSNENDGNSGCQKPVITRRVRSQENICKSEYSKESAAEAVTPAEEPATETLFEGYQLIWQHGFACPVMGLDSLDVTGDGMLDLVVMTLKGLHILQHDLNYAAEILLKRLTENEGASEVDDAFTKLQTETFGR